MNPNFESSQDAPAADQMEEVAEGNQLTFNTQEYPELEGVKPGDPVEVRCQGQVGDAGNGQVTIQVTGQCEISTEGQADKAMKDMSQQSYNQAASSGEQGSDF